MTETTALAAALTTWARGYYPSEAAVKLLVDTGMLRKVAHLVQEDDRGTEPRAWIDWEDAAAWFDEGTGMSGGEARIVAVALALAEARPVNLGDAMTGVDHKNARAILAACAHAAGIELNEPSPSFPSGMLANHELPTFQQMRREAGRLLSDARDTLASDWREGTGPNHEQAQAAMRARQHIASAKTAIHEAGPQSEGVVELDTDD
ncbi:MAG TPA: hypothetical protein VIQ30_22810 [Pseudonocardia sp.]